MLLSRRGFISFCGGVLASGLMDTPGFAAPSTLLTRAIPGTGERLPVIGLGTYQAFDISDSGSDFEQGREVLQRFYAEGGRVVDSSPMYGNAERVIGKLSQAIGINDKLFLATKVWTTGRQAGVSQMQQSLQLLERKTIDLMQVHNLLDLEGHLPALREWKSAGRLRYIGVSHYVESAHDDLERVLRKHKFDFVQLNYSLAERGAEDRFLPAAADLGVAVIINRPFAQGSLFGRVRGKPLPPTAKDIGCESWAQYFLKYIVSHPAVTCTIPATRKLAHLVDNMGAARGTLPDQRQRERMRQEFAQL